MPRWRCAAIEDPPEAPLRSAIDAFGKTVGKMLEPVPPI
jgi:hypothetical protein